jgi:hypothetical protein
MGEELQTREAGTNDSFDVSKSMQVGLPEYLEDI